MRVVDATSAEPPSVSAEPIPSNAVGSMPVRGNEPERFDSRPKTAAPVLSAGVADSSASARVDELDVLSLEPVDVVLELVFSTLLDSLSELLDSELLDSLSELLDSELLDSELLDSLELDSLSELLDSLSLLEDESESSSSVPSHSLTQRTFALLPESTTSTVSFTWKPWLDGV